MIRRFHSNIGCEYELNKVSLIVQLITMTKENVYFSESEIKVFIKATSNYFNAISKKKSSARDLFGEILVTDEDESLDDCTFYKYIPNDIYRNFISKGAFQLGSLKKYREIENKKIRDEKEGFCNLIIHSANREILTSVISGFNHYVFCGTYKVDESNYMSSNFGNTVIRIKNIKAFADKIQETIGAKKWTLKKVNYTDYKAYLINQEIKDLSGVGPDLSEELFQYLLMYTEFPSIFSKPVLFQPENELRLSFEMNTNVKKEHDFNNMELLDEIEVIN